MRTRVTLDPDVERLLRECMRRRGLTLKEALNNTIRAGLGGTKIRRVPRFVQNTYSLGPVRNFNWDKALTAAEALEDEAFSRKFAPR
jgi:hypothetical protein